jgi:RNA polymerase sigma factor (sigma-70 family)
MEASALKYSGGIGLHGRTPMLRLQSDERLVALLRRGNSAAFEVLVSRYETRLLAFCRHMLGSREDAEDVMQEVMTAAFNAMLADERPINVRPWLYRIARNRSLNHMRRVQAIAVDSMDLQLAEHGASTADKADGREEFRLLVEDIRDLPETQRTALVLREMDALSYEQIAEVMDTTVPSVKSLLVRARLSLAEAAEARLLTCEEVRTRLAEVAEGLRRRPDPLVRRHLRGCKRCSVFRVQLKETNRALAALMPIGPMVVLKKVLLVHLGHSAGAGSTAAGSGAAASGAAASGAGAVGAGTAGTAGGVVAGATATAGSSGFISAGLGAIAAKTAAGIAAAALVTAGAVEVGHPSHRAVNRAAPVVAVAVQAAAVQAPVTSFAEPSSSTAPSATGRAGRGSVKASGSSARPARVHRLRVSAPAPPLTTTPGATVPAATTTLPAAPPPGRSVTQTDPTVLEPPATTTPAVTTPTAATTTASSALATPSTPSTTATATTSTTTPTPTTTTTTTTTTTSTTTTPITTTTTPTTTTTTPTTTTPTTTTPITTTTTPTTTTTTTTTTTSQTGTTPGGS